MREQMHQLTASGLSCVRSAVQLFSALNFSLSSADLLLVEGENGCGKSSLLRLLAGLATPSAGVITWNQQAITHATCHYIGHENGLKLGLTVAENIMLFATLHGVEKLQLETLLQQMHLSPQKNTLAKNLSAGQKRKLALSRLVLVKKALWIVDEPLTALDAAGQALFFTLLQQHLNTGGICVMTSHQHLQPIFTNAKVLRLSQC